MKNIAILFGIVITLSFIFVLGGLTAISWSLWQRVEDSRAPVQLTHDSIIFADEHLVIDLKNKSTEQIKQELKAIGPTSEIADSTREKIKDIYFVYEESKNTDQGLVVEKKVASPTIFATSAGLIITDDLLRFLDPDFMLGLYVGPQIEPFYIFQTKTYKNSADALLHNENEITSQLLLPFIDLETETKIKQIPFQDKIPSFYRLEMPYTFDRAVRELRSRNGMIHVQSPDLDARIGAGMFELFAHLVADPQDKPFLINYIQPKTVSAWTAELIQKGLLTYTPEEPRHFAATPKAKSAVYTLSESRPTG